jgi:hypothetical protein
VLHFTLPAKCQAVAGEEHGRCGATHG